MAVMNFSVSSFKFCQQVSVHQRCFSLCHVGPALPAPTTRSGAATTGKLIGRQIGIQGKLIGRQIGIQIGIQGKLIGMQGKRESRSLFPLLADHISIYWM
jgi:hypothetical protein